jgi:hypothetical protein
MSKRPPDRVPNWTDNGGAARQSEAAESDDLLRFCAEIALDEIEFEDWQQLHQRLDLRIPLLITATESQHPGFKLVSYVRSVKFIDHEKKLKKSKIKVSKKISWDAPLQDGQEFLLVHEGDQEGDNFGDAKIVVKIKDT